MELPLNLPVPVKIERIANQGLKIEWSDGTKSELTSEILRRECPCATCKESRGEGSHSKPLLSKKKTLKIIEHTRDEELALLEVRPVGNYAISIKWGDGHNTGIYSFDQLYILAKQ